MKVHLNFFPLIYGCRSDILRGQRNIAGNTYTRL